MCVSACVCVYLCVCVCATSSTLGCEIFAGLTGLASRASSGSDSVSDSGWRSEVRRRQQTNVKGGGASLRKDTTSRRDFPYTWTPLTCRKPSEQLLVLSGFLLAAAFVMVLTSRSSSSGLRAPCFSAGPPGATEEM